MVSVPGPRLSQAFLHRLALPWLKLGFELRSSSKPIGSGQALQAGATGAVKAVKMSAKLVSGHQLAAGDDVTSGGTARPAGS